MMKNEHPEHTTPTMINSGGSILLRGAFYSVKVAKLMIVGKW